jgi:uncharacterized protein YbjT (DUF2867 family)
MILVTGATGNVGREVVNLLSAVTLEYSGGYQRFADAFKVVEDAARASGLQWTILRSSDYASTLKRFGMGVEE